MSMFLQHFHVDKLIRIQHSRSPRCRPRGSRRTTDPPLETTDPPLEMPQVGHTLRSCLVHWWSWPACSQGSIDHILNLECRVDLGHVAVVNSGIGCGGKVGDWVVLDGHWNISAGIRWGATEGDTEGRHVRNGLGQLVRACDSLHGLLRHLHLQPSEDVNCPHNLTHGYLDGGKGQHSYKIQQ